MKFLEIPQLEKLNSLLEEVDLGDHLLSIRVQCYSLKMISQDRKLQNHLKKEYSNDSLMKHYINQNKPIDTTELDNSINKLVQTPLGNIRESSTLKLVTYFISTLNNSYPEFDFKDLPPARFRHELKNEYIVESIMARMSSLQKLKPSLVENFWCVINEVIEIKQCKIYSYLPSDDELQSLHAGSLWSMDLFFLNEQRKQLLYLSLFSISKLFRGQSPDKINIDDIEDNEMEWLPDDEMQPSNSISLPPLE